MTAPTSPRIYGGIHADARVANRRDRLIEAGLDLLGGPDDSATLTVRGVCKTAGVVARYFYESFDDADALAVTVYDEMLDELVRVTLVAVGQGETDEREQIRIGLTAIVGHLAEDPRRGRLLFNTATTHPALAPKRLETMRMMTGLLAAHAEAFYEVEHSPRLEAVSRFLVGGFGEALTAWQHNDLALPEAGLVELCVDLFAASAKSLQVA
jgi:AcrR family transcriptional regulator